MQERYREVPTQVTINETNTLRVPPGRKPFTVVLRDGTIATVSSGSSLTFPDDFTGNKREVQATGEVYFSVKSNAARPFIVHIDHNTHVEVTGTRFTIRAFANEPIQVTLIEGHVTVVDSIRSARLEAGEQVTLYGHKAINIIKLKDPESAAFIPQREFNFNGLDIRSVLLQMSQWYGQPIVVQGKLSGDPSSGQFPRHEKMTDILNTLKRYNDFDFEEKDGVVIITGHAK
jgi:ferric-dicitrate binding protein FerR (iron transport regulator)